MQYIFFLSGEQLDIAVHEVLSLLDVSDYSLDKNRMNVHAQSIEHVTRLAYTKSVHKFLFNADARSVMKQIETYDWNKEYKKDFKVSVSALDDTCVHLDVREIASIIWHSVDKPRVNVNDPETHFHFFLNKDCVFVSKLVHINKEQFTQRKNSLLPGTHPSSMHPKLARAMVNLTSAKTGVIVDPFCGSGGIILEAGLMGFQVKGFDIEMSMLKKAKKNLDFFGISDYSLEKKDALTLTKVDYVVTDLPYAKNTKKQSLEKLYKRFFSRIRDIKPKVAVIGLPDFCNHRKLAMQARITIKNEFLYYLHKSLSKRIIVV